MDLRLLISGRNGGPTSGAPPTPQGASPRALFSFGIEPRRRQPPRGSADAPPHCCDVTEHLILRRFSSVVMGFALRFAGRPGYRQGSPGLYSQFR